jgi:hypothetical protein
MKHFDPEKMKEENKDLMERLSKIKKPVPPSKSNK